MEKKKKEPVSYDEVFLYLSDKKYSNCCSDDSRKRAIRSKAAGFTTADGVLITREKNSIEPRRWIRDLETRMQILNPATMDSKVVTLGEIRLDRRSPPSTTGKG